MIDTDIRDLVLLCLKKIGHTTLTRQTMTRLSQNPKGDMLLHATYTSFEGKQ